MNKIVLLFFMLIPSVLIGQGIRKHYTEFSEQERAAYRAALDELIDDNTIEDYADYHADPNQDGTNGNSTGSGDDSQIHQDEEFLPWHRWFLLEFEWELKSINPDLTIPYWDWTGTSDPTGVTSESSSGPLWSNSQIGNLSWNDDFIDSYNSELSLSRQLGGLTLPSQSEVNGVLSQTNFTTFRQQLEGNGSPNLHGRPHVWVGGIMANLHISPTDPVFYFHHAMVDKIWQNWTELGRTSSFSDNNMPTFDGSVSGFPDIDPSDIIDSRELGIFYSDAVNHLATVSYYTVTNSHISNEKFIYKYDIIVHHFSVPSGKNTTFISPQSITIQSDFEAALGATFEIKNN